MRVLLLKRVENIVVKGEIARFGQFFLLSQCYQKSSAAEASESIYMWERVKKLLCLQADEFSVIDTSSPS